MLLWADGFGHWGSDANAVAGGNYTQNNATLNISAVNPRTGGYCMKQTNFGAGRGWVSKFLGGNRQSLGMGIAVQLDTFPSGGEYGIAFQDADGQVQFQVLFNPDGSLTVWNGQKVFPYGSTFPGIVTAGAYAYIEIFATCDDTAGTVAMQVNGQPAVVFENIDTNPFGSANFNSVAWGKVNSGDTVAAWYADLVFWDLTGTYNNKFLGDVRCRTILPKANGADQDWTASAGAAWDCLNNVPPTGAHISADTVGDKSSFAFDAIPTNSSAVFGIAVYTDAAKTDAGTCEITPALASNGTSADLAPFNPGTGNGYFSRISETNPDTGNPWNYAQVNLMLASVERTA